MTTGATPSLFLSVQGTLAAFVALGAPPRLPAVSSLSGVLTALLMSPPLPPPSWPPQPQLESYSVLRCSALPGDRPPLLPRPTSPGDVGFQRPPVLLLRSVLRSPTHPPRGGGYHSVLLLVSV